MPASLRNPEVRGILQAIKEGKVIEFKPSFSSEKGIFYPAVEKIVPNSSINYSFFEDLEKCGIVRGEFYDSVLTCPSCGSHKVFVKLRCPSCGSTDIDSGNAIEHLYCGHIDVEGGFVKGERLICPKCGKELRVLGVDYRKPGIFFKCGTCGNIRSIPERGYICGDCGEIFTENQLDIKKFFTFKVEPKGKALIDKWMINFDELVKSLEKHRYVAKQHAVLRGASGIEHNFELVVWNPIPSISVEYVIDVEIEENEINELKVLSFFTKATDVEAKKKILVAIPSLTQKARDIAKKFSILVMEHLSPGDVAATILDVLDRDVKNIQMKID